MLLIDGVRYEAWIPEKEVEEFQPIVKEHVQDIFGNKSKYIEARRLKSKAGIGSVPDGFVIIFGDSPQWHIVEVELSSHQLYDHVVNQVGRFINGIKNPVTQKNIIDTIYQEITGSKISKVEVEEAIGSGEIHKFLTDLISLPPILTIIIEKKTRELDEAIDLLKYSPIEIVEFQTFTREGVGLAVHAHLFEPLYKPVISIKQPGDVSAQPTPENSLEVTLVPSCMKYYYIHIPAAKKHLFPGLKTTLELDTDIGPIETGFNIDPTWGAWLQKGLYKWFKAHGELKEGDKVTIEVTEPMTKYRLEILKE